MPRRQSRTLLIAGNLLLAAAIFVPWLQLSASFSSPFAINAFIGSLRDAKRWEEL